MLVTANQLNTKHVPAEKGQQVAHLFPLSDHTESPIPASLR